MEQETLGKATVETIKMLVQANNTISYILEILAIEKLNLESEGAPTETVDKVRDNLKVVRSDFTYAVGKLVEATNYEKEKKTIKWAPLTTTGIQEL